MAQTRESACTTKVNGRIPTSFPSNHYRNGGYVLSNRKQNRSLARFLGCGSRIRMIGGSSRSTRSCSAVKTCYPWMVPTPHSKTIIEAIRLMMRKIQDIASVLDGFHHASSLGSRMLHLKSAGLPLHALAFFSLLLYYRTRPLRAM
jgi:hypothetical protein